MDDEQRLLTELIATEKITGNERWIKHLREGKRFACMVEDVPFKAVLMRPPDFAKQLVILFLPLPENTRITSLRYLPNEVHANHAEPSINLAKKPPKSFRLDVPLEVKMKIPKKKEVQIAYVDIELESHLKKTILLKNLLYSMRMLFNQVGRGDDYENVDPVYSLCFTAKQLPEFKEQEGLILRGAVALQETIPARITDLWDMTVVQLNKCDKEMSYSKDLKTMIPYILLNGHEFTSYQCLRILTALPKKGVKIMSQYFEVLADYSVEAQKNDMNILLELYKSQEEDRKAEAKAEKEAEMKLLYAQRCIKIGLDPAVISDITGLTEDELKHIAKDL